MIMLKIVYHKLVKRIRNRFQDGTMKFILFVKMQCFGILYGYQVANLKQHPAQYNEENKKRVSLSNTQIQEGCRNSKTGQTPKCKDYIFHGLKKLSIVCRTMSKSTMVLRKIYQNTLPIFTNEFITL